MGFTYLAGSNLPLHQVRGKIGDTTDAARPGLRLEDEEILAKIAEGADVTVTAVKCLDLLLARFAREADVGPKAAGLEATRRFERLLQLRLILLEEIATGGGGGTSGGAGPSIVMLSEAYRQRQIADPDLIQHTARQGDFDGDP